MTHPRQASGTRLIYYRWLTALFSFTATVIAGEVMARWLVPEERFWRVSNVYQDVIDPGMQYRYKPNLKTIAFGVPLETNELGLRGRNWERAKPDNTRRIALIGDSYAFGFGVRFEETVGEQLNRILEERTGQRYQVLNFGVNGYNSSQELAMLNDLAVDFEPDLTILLPTNNDDEAAMVADDEGWLHYDGQARNRKSRVRNQWDPGEVSGLMKNSRLMLYLNTRYRLFRQEFNKHGVAMFLPDEDWMGEIPPGPVEPHLRETVYRPLKQMLSSLEARGVPAVLASACATTDYRVMLRDLRDETGVPTIELMTLFPEAHNWREWAAKFGLGWDDHPNAEAHLRFARALANEVERLGTAANKRSE